MSPQVIGNRGLFVCAATHSAVLVLPTPGTPEYCQSNFVACGERESRTMQKNYQAPSLASD